MPDDFSDFESELDAMPAPRGGGRPAPAGGGQRQRATAGMVSLRYRLKQFWKVAGIEMLLVLAVLLGTRHVLYTGSATPESQHLLARAAEIASGQLDMRGADLKARAAADPMEAKSYVAYSVTLPMALVDLATGGGRVPALILSLLAAVGALLFTYWVGKELFTVEAGIAAAFLLALFPAFSAAAGGFSALTFAFCYFSLSLFLFLRANRAAAVPTYLYAGLAAGAALYAMPTIAVLFPVFLVHLVDQKRFRPQVGMFVAGIAAFAIVVEVLGVLLCKATPLAGLGAFFAAAQAQGAGGNAYLRLGQVAEQLFSNPMLLPFALLALVSVGYTLRTSKTTWSYLPLGCLIFAYLLLEFFPVKLAPYLTLPKGDAQLALLGLPLVWTIGAFFSGAATRNMLRWGLALVAACALPLMLVL